MAAGEAPFLVLSTVETEEDAVRLAKVLVQERLVACVNVIPGLRSIYRWQGAVSDEEELLLLMKTTRERIDGLRDRLHELHPYEVPEFVVVEIASLGEAYGAWLRGSVALE